MLKRPVHTLSMVLGHRTRLDECVPFVAMDYVNEPVTNKVVLNKGLKMSNQDQLAK
jgi:hypothetical protein